MSTVKTFIPLAALKEKNTINKKLTEINVFVLHSLSAFLLKFYSSSCCAWYAQLRANPVQILIFIVLFNFQSTFTIMYQVYNP